MVIFSLKTLQKPTTTHVTNPEEETTHRSPINTREYNIFHIYFRPFVSDRASRNIVLRESVQVASSLKRAAKKTHTHTNKNDLFFGFPSFCSRFGAVFIYLFSPSYILDAFLRHILFQFVDMPRRWWKNRLFFAERVSNIVRIYFFIRKDFGKMKRM